LGTFYTNLPSELFLERINLECGKDRAIFKQMSEFEC
jgi:hypothetical protein